MTIRRRIAMCLAVLLFVFLTACGNTQIDNATESKVRGALSDLLPTTSSNSKVAVTDNTEIPSPSDLEEMEAEIIRQTNEYRASLGLCELELDTQLTYVARVRAHEIVTTWSHIRADGSIFADILAAMHYPSPRFGENLGRYQDDVDEVMQMWKESEGHNANLIGDFTKIGAGVYVSDDGYLHYVQIFAK